jgi:CHAD domain-containing protein
MTSTKIDDSYQLLACQYLREQLDRLRRELQGVRRNEDIEPVHQARVASRRMRAALRMFAECFEAKNVRRWQKRARRLTKGLGAARDTDVQIEFVSQFLRSLDPKDRTHRPGVDRLLLRLRQKREAVQPDVIRTLDKLEDGALAEMCGEVARVLFTLKTRDVSLASPVLFDRTSEHILSRVKDLLAWEYSLEEEEDAHGHHQLRIAAKKLRYTLEICDPAYQGELAPYIKSVKHVQSLLGDIHDCDVWVEYVDAFIEQERRATVAYFGHARPFNRLRPGLLLLRDERRKHRNSLFGDLSEYWHTLREQRFWDALADAVVARQRPAEPPASPVQEEQNDGQDETHTDHRGDQ